MNNTAEENLKKLKRSRLPQKYVESHNGTWNHQDWLDFCAQVEKKGLLPIDFDQVGALLEKLKSAYWDKKRP